MATNKRVRGVAIHRPILIGSTATPLTPAEKLSADPHHTHKWTVAVRSAASNTLPTHALDERGLPKAQPASTTPNAGAAAGTRGRDTETDYHRHVGGKDDISHFIRRVQFKLHESFPQPTRNIDRPPFQVTETGWGEFEIMVKIWWVPEAGEKFLQTPHYLKLHPWPNMPLPAAPPAPAAPTDANLPATATADSTSSANGATGNEPSAAGDKPTQDTQMADAATEVTTDVTQKDAPASASSDSTANQTASTAASATVSSEAALPAAQEAGAPAVAPPPPPMAPVIHSWQYDEIVFPEPTEAFYQTLISHAPTPLPATAHEAFTDPKIGRLQQGFTTPSGTISGSEIPPYPLYAPSAAPYIDGISQASIQAEADRLDHARIEAVKELERDRERLIEAEKELRRVRQRADEITGAAGGAIGI
ncbi:unnamed protein product [Sympodiomycopsis kandeliae]